MSKHLICYTLWHVDAQGFDVLSPWVFTYFLSSIINNPLALFGVCNNASYGEIKIESLITNSPVTFSVT